MKYPASLAKALFAATLVTTTVSGCITNPVTGEREFRLISEGQELQMGAQSYAPLTQMQGGEYTVDPALTSYVASIGRRMAAVSDRDLPYEFVVINNPVPNAWALPGGKIAINLGLLWELDNEAELAAVLGHEVVHAAAGHSARQQTSGMGLQLGVMAIGLGLGNKDYGTLALGAAQLGAGLIGARNSREAELESDLYGMEYMSKAGYDPQGAVMLQQTFVRLSEGRSQDLFSSFFATHPPSQERVDTNMETAERLPQSGQLHRERFQQAMAAANAARPAYEAMQQGQEALAKGDYDIALAFAKKAIDISPSEARFHILRGDIRMAQKRYKDARTNYQRALNHEPEYFGSWLSHGAASYQLGDKATAKSDLTRSLEMMPTVGAHFLLGHIARDEGDTANAIAHYKAVVESKAPQAEAAYQELVRIDLPNSPGQYLASRLAIDQNGMILVEVVNRAPSAVRSVVATVSDGQRAWKIRINGTLQSEESRIQRSNLGPYSSEQASQLKVIVSEAQLAD